MKIGISGATGQLGRIVVNKLTSKGRATNVVALVRSPEKAADLGVEARAFDYNAPETLAPALAGIDSLLLISGNEPGARLRQHASVLEAAKKAGVRHIVYTSLLRADSTTLVLGPEHKGTEELIIASGIRYTILRNGWYFENYFSGLSHVASSGELFGSAGEGKISAATREDYAEAAVAALTSQGHENKTYELAGDTSFTLADLAKTVSEVS
ncbi:MAG: SDR family oxidoreductase, partial [Sphingobacteriales bacterium]